MPSKLQLTLSPAGSCDEQIVRQKAAFELGVGEQQIISLKIQKRSVDARSRNIKVLLTAEVYLRGETVPDMDYRKHYPDVTHSRPVIIAGAGPAGLFAALKLIELGLKPVIIERGKKVRDRRRDLAAINKEQIVNPESNYCFGEGGAGTYSDGKLYTRSTKRGDVREVLETFVAHGADENILVEAHPHIGTNKLPHIIVGIRETILQNGGEIHFETKLTDLITREGKLHAVRILKNGQEDEMAAAALILATGHSARDIFELLHSKNILIEAKPFAMGVRVEHPQSLIDSIQYHCPVQSVDDLRNYLPASSYSLVQQVKERGVYSFCMCPGGIIAPCATSPGEVVTNGWSPSKRNNPYANSGIVVSILAEDLQKYSQHGALAGLRYQQEVEKNCWIAGGKTQVVPAQRLMDFVNGKLSDTLPQTSYQPGIKTELVNEVLPEFISTRLREGFKFFGTKMKGYLTNEAVVHAVESRTSSPVRIPRDPETLQHPQVSGLFPCGEGAGYAGGIVSAAIDGQKCAAGVKEMLG